MIYLVEDDDSIRELVIYTLRSTGMDAKGFGLPSEFWHAMEEQLPELVLLGASSSNSETRARYLLSLARSTVPILRFGRVRPVGL